MFAERQGLSLGFNIWTGEKVFIIRYLDVDLMAHKKGCRNMKYIHMRIYGLLEEHSIFKNRICKDLIDTNLIIKLCEYLKCNIADLLEICEK